MPIRHTNAKLGGVPRLAWNPEKDANLRQSRGIGFEEIAFYIASGDLVEVLEHPHPERYPGQKIFVVWCRDYAYLVPFVESEDEVFLKTIIPSRRWTRRIREKSEEL